MDKEECINKFAEPETEEHIQGKKDLFEWIKKQDDVTDVILEGWIPSTNQSPDISFKYKHIPCVIEYQCTPISTEYCERHELYQSAGIKDIWICGVQKYFQAFHKGPGKKSVTKFELESHLYYDPQSKHIFSVNHTMSEKAFRGLSNGKFYNLMETLSDFKNGTGNYFFIKDPSKNYVEYRYWPFLTGRSSNKHPHKLVRYVYKQNVSLAKCFTLDQYPLKRIFKGGK